MELFERLEIGTITAKLSEDGLSASLILQTRAPGARRFQFVMTRDQCDRLGTSLSRQQARVPKPTQRRTIARESK